MTIVASVIQFAPDNEHLDDFPLLGVGLPGTTCDFFI